MLLVRCPGGDDAINKTNRQLSPTWKTLPGLRLNFFRLGANDVAIGVPDLFVYCLCMAVIGDTNVLAPPGFYVDPVNLAVDAYGHSETGGDERLIARGVNLICRVGLGVDPAGGAVELGAGIVAPLMHLEVFRLVGRFGCERTCRPSIRSSPSTLGASFPTR